MRSFVALTLPDETVTALYRLQNTLRSGRPVPSENLHLTLAFLGDQPESTLEELHHDLSVIRLPAFPLALRSLTVFGGKESRALAVSVEPSPPLDALYRSVKSAARKADLGLPSRRFRPHITIARPKPRDLANTEAFIQDNAGFAHDSADVMSFALYQSILRPDGAEHEVLASYPLGLR